MLVSSPHAVRVILELSLPWLTPVARAAVEQITLAGDSTLSSTLLAHRLDLRTRHQLAYCLRRNGLPPYEELVGWVRVLRWMVEWEETGCSLCSQALRGASYPSSRYRLVRRLTGTGWVEVRHRGLAWVLAEFLARCAQPSHGVAEKSCRPAS